MSEAAEYRIDELAAITGVTSRNIRAYQERGLLAPPRVRGRVGIYHDAHVVRIRLINRLLDQGFTSAHIADFIAGWEQGLTLSEVLRLEEPRATPRTRLRDTFVSRDDLLDLIGNDADVDRLLSTGRFVPVDGGFTTADPILLDVIRDASTNGLPPTVTVEVISQITRSMRTLADSSASIVVGFIQRKYGSGWQPTGEEIGKLTAQLEALHRLTHYIKSSFDSISTESVTEAIAQYMATELQRESDTAAWEDPATVRR